MKGATLALQFSNLMSAVSIRAPREGGDRLFLAGEELEHVSIGAPREGGDKVLVGMDICLMQFQSAPPVKGATRRFRKACR